MKKLFILLLMSVAFVTSAQNIPEKPNKFINDFANVMSDDDEERLKGICDMIQQESTSQVAVLITNDLDENSSIEEYAEKVFNKWGIGQKGVDNGVLIVVCPNIRKSRIEVGYGLEGILTDAYTKRLQVEHFRPNFKNNDYYIGIAEALLAIKKEINPEAIELARQEKVQQEKESAENAAAVGEFFINFLLILAVGGLIGFAIYYSIKKKREKEEREREERERVERIERQKRQEEERLERNANEAKSKFETLCKNATSELSLMNNFQNATQLLSNVKEIQELTTTRLKFKKREEYSSICQESTNEINKLITEIKKNYEIKQKVEKSANNCKTTNFDNSLRNVYSDVLRMNERLREYNIPTSVPNQTYPMILSDIIQKADRALDLLSTSRFSEANTQILAIDKIIIELNQLHTAASNNVETIDKSIRFLNNEADSKFADYVKSAKAKFADSDMTDSNLKKEWTKYINNLNFRVDKSANPLTEFKRISDILLKVKDFNDKASSVIAAEERARRKKKEAEEEEERRRRKKKEDDEDDERRRRNSYSSGASIGYSSSESSSSSSSSSFDFGGGSSGGGGSSDSW